MENCLGLRLKRKEFDDVDDEIFADFCLSSPASKIRRLDADLPPIIEEDAAGIPLKHEQPIPESVVLNEVVNQVNPADIEELPFVPENNEKAIVLFKPINKPIFYSPNNLSIDPSLILSFKNHTVLRAHHSLAEDDAERNGDDSELNGCKAIIPWAPAEPLYQRPILASQTEVSGTMESEDMDAAMMEIEDASISSVGQQEANEHIKRSAVSEGQQPQWQQQQHCMIPHPPQNITTPVVWYR